MSSLTISLVLTRDFHDKSWPPGTLQPAALSFPAVLQAKGIQLAYCACSNPHKAAIHDRMPAGIHIMQTCQGPGHESIVRSAPHICEGLLSEEACQVTVEVGRSRVSQTHRRCLSSCSSMGRLPVTATAAQNMRLKRRQ